MELFLAITLGALFGFAIAGYCPGTALTAFATGRKDGLIFVLGGLVGAFVYTLVYGWLNENTALFEQIAGGNVSLAQTGNDKYQPLLTSINGSLLGIGIGLIFIIIAVVLPQKLIKKD